MARHPAVRLSVNLVRLRRVVGHADVLDEFADLSRRRRRQQCDNGRDREVDEHADRADPLGRDTEEPVFGRVPSSSSC